VDQHPDLELKLKGLKEWIKGLWSPVGTGFSGGLDSSFLLAALLRWSDVPVSAFTVISPLISSFQRDIIEETSDELGIKPHYIEWNALNDETVCSNNELRCYFCKKKMYSLMLEAAGEKGAGNLLDGTQADDLYSDRPGLRALRELGIKTPLAEIGINKDEIRSALRQWGYSFWGRDAESCMATRVSRNNEISKENLIIIEKLEDFFRLKRINLKKIRIIKKSVYIFLESRENECLKMDFGEIERIDERFTFFLKN